MIMIIPFLLSFFLITIPPYSVGTPITKIGVMGTGRGMGSLSFVEYKGKHIITAYHVCQGSRHLYSNEGNKIVLLKVLRVSEALHLCEVENKVTGDYLNIAENSMQDGIGYGYPGSHELTKVKLTFLAYALAMINGVISPYTLFKGNLQHGMSGGPTVSKAHELVGINAAINESAGTSILVPGESVKQFIDGSSEEE